MGYGKLKGPRAAVALACLAAASIAAQPACKLMDQPKPVVFLTALVYTGRVNPYWTLSDARTASLRRLVEALPPGGSPLPPIGLGYSGIIVDGASLVLPRCYSLRVYRGTVAAQCDGGARNLVDAGRQVERFLAESGLKQADAGAYNIVIQDINAAP
jgi:hypothetical protein